MKTRYALVAGALIAGMGSYAGAARAESKPLTHDGFYLRLSAGAGYASDSFKYTGPFGFATASGKGEGAAGMFDAAAGYAVKPGIIVGGGVFIDQVASPKVTVEGVDQSSNYSVGTLGMIGPIFEWYPKARGGFHLGAGIGVARLTVKDKQDNQYDNTPVGGGGVFTIGYDWWVGDEWSIGVEGRLLAATLHDTLAVGILAGDAQHTWTSGAAMFTVTYN